MLSSLQILKILRVHILKSEKDNVFQHFSPFEYSIYAESVEKPHELIEKLEIENWDLVISDFHIPGFCAKEALEIIKKKSLEIPFILISDGIGEESVADMMKAGAEDVVMESRLERIVPVVKRILREKEFKNQETLTRKIANKAFAAKEQMLAIVSHDIKNPLSAIQLEAQMLYRTACRHEESLLAAEVRTQSTRILKTTERLKNLIIDLLDKNKSEDGLASINRQKIDPISLIHEVVDSTQPLIQQKNLFIIKKIPASFSNDLYLDKSKMFQVISNLLINAVKFTPPKGTIELSISEKEKEVIFSVTDTGPGLRRSDLNRVFEKYWSGGNDGTSGTGLGLFICKTIIEAHGGHIMVENQPSGGAHFWFSIPKSSGPGASDSWVKDYKRKIVVIDDDNDLREVICWALGKEGFSVHSYAGAKEALESLKNGRHSPQLIVVDFQMDGMNGQEFLSLKNDIDNPDVRNCPVVMISASPREALQVVSLELCKIVIPKPIDLEGLVETIKQYIDH